MSTQAALGIGYVVEVVGIGLTTLDIWFDHAGDFVRKSIADARRDFDRIRREVAQLLGRPVVERISSSASLPFEAAGSAHGFRSVPDNASLDEQLRMLRDLVRDHDERLSPAEGRIDRLFEQADRNLETLREETRASTEALIAAAEGQYRGWRLLGILLTVTGATLVIIASVNAS